jgi:hypothetical protein
VLAAAILGETGDIGRFPGRNAFAKYNGTAPAKNSSGGRARHRARRACNHRLKRAFWLAAYAAVRHDDLAEAYYQRCLARGLSKIESMKRVARRMSDIVYALLVRGERYDRSRLVRTPDDQTRTVPEAGGTASSDQSGHSKVQSLAGFRQHQATQRTKPAQPGAHRSPEARAGHTTGQSPSRSRSDAAHSSTRAARSPG